MKNGIIDKIKNIPDRVINNFITFQWKNWFIYCFILFIVGIVINFGTHFVFPNFILHQILLITATTMLVAAMKSFFCDIQLFHQDTTGGLLDKNLEIISLFKKKLLPRQRSPWPFFMAVLIAGFFFACIVLLKYIKMDIIGIYALYIAGSSVLIGVYGYMQYLYFLWFISHVEKCETFTYNMYVPAATPWVSQLAKTSQRLRNFFLFIGLIYVIEYSILIPADAVVITDTSILLSMPNNVAFILSWIALFLLVIIAFPVINHIQRLLIKKLISHLKQNTIDELSVLMDVAKDNSKTKNSRLTSVVTYSVVIENIRQSKDYPIKRQFSYETIMTMITFIVHIFNLYNKINEAILLNPILIQF